jgi:hypothetical protein
MHKLSAPPLATAPLVALVLAACAPITPSPAALDRASEVPVPASAPYEPPALHADERALVREILAGGTLRALAPGGLDAGSRGAPTFVEARVDRDGQTLTFAVRDCAATFGALHSKTARANDTSPYRIRVSAYGVSAEGRTLYTLAEPCAELLEDRDARPSDTIAAAVAIASIVGPIFTVTETRTEARGGGSPYQGERWLTYDARTGEPPPLTAAVTDDSLLAALQADPFLRAQLPAESLQALRSATTAGQAIEASSVPDLLVSGAYALVPERSGDHVTLRLAVRAFAAGFDPNHVRPLSLSVRPRPEAKGWFDAAGR